MAFPASCATHEYWYATRAQFTVALFRDGTKPISEKPGGGVDECFFLAERSSDAKKARIAPRLLLSGLSLPLVGP